MKESGFEGSWATLSGSHRLPESVVPVLRAFISEFIPDADVNLPEVALGDQLFGCDLRWTNVRGDELVERVTSALVEVLQPGDVAFADCAVLLPGHKAGVDFVAQWQGTHGGIWPVRHVFDRVREVSRRRKMNFWPGSPGLKASTIKSFKGWEARFVLLGIDELPAQGGADMRSIDRANALASIYVGLSRVNRSDLGSLLWVFCSEPNLEDFGSTHFIVRP